MAVVRPPALRKGHTVAVIGPSSYPAYPPMNLSEGVDFLRKQGFKVVVGRTLREALRHRFYSADDQIRADELNWAFKNPDIDGIFCARGGTGALRILDKLDYDVIRRNPKVFVGYSDITGFQMAILKRTGLITFQGPMPAIHGKGETEEKRRAYRYSWKILFDIVMRGATPELKNPVNAPPFKVISGGKARGQLTGGNIILFTLMLGSTFEPDTKGRILFLENIEENPWRNDDYLAGLTLAGKLQAANGLIFGEFPEPAEYKGPTPSVEEVIADAVKRIGGKPSILNFACCHGGKYVLTLALGAEVELNADRGSVRLLKRTVD